MSDAPPTPIQWFSSNEFFKSSVPIRINPVIRILLASDGTTTTALQALLLCPIGVEVIRQKKVRLDPATAKFLMVAPGGDALARVVWLTAHGKRLVCASSIIRLEGLTRPILQALKSRQKPLGLLLNESGQPMIRDKLQIARITNRSVMKTLDLPAAGSFWARRYRINLGESLTACIQELFSDRLMDQWKS